MLKEINSAWVQAKGMLLPEAKEVDFNVKIGRLEYPAGQLFETLKDVGTADLSDLFSFDELEEFYKEAIKASEQIMGAQPLRMINLPGHKVEDEFVRQMRERASLLGQDAPYVQTIMQHMFDHAVLASGHCSRDLAN